MGIGDADVILYHVLYKTKVVKKRLEIGKQLIHSLNSPMSSWALGFTSLFFFFVGILGLSFVIISIKRNKNLPLPPGPPRLPIIGSAYLIP